MIQISKISGVAILLCITMIGYGQSKKDIQEKGIVSKTVQEYFIEEGADEPVVESIEKYNKEGETIELQEFNRLGDIKRWEKYGYDAVGQLVEEVFLDSKGRITQTEKSVYEDGLRVEKRYYNSRGKLYKKKVYEYEYRQ
ncbi:MAG: hypothetical protein KAT15_26390 [Bacteroidales bacterium]|nr:hypothetical protein [Bacteroidales bacterium]